MNIIDEIGLPAALGQLAEECAELAKAALKLQRIIYGTNPTPVTREQAEDALMEETVDVILTLDVIEQESGMRLFDMPEYLRKFDRWVHRLEVARGKEDENGQT